MKQALHIFLKDVRYLRLELCLFFVLAGAFGWVHFLNVDVFGSLLEIAAVFLIARVVLADPIPGDRQFWLTRPYRRSSLALAKLLFIAICICLPLALAQIGMLRRAGFPLSATLPRLLCSDVMLFVFVAVPIAALASVTSNVVPFISTVLISAFIAFAAPTAIKYWFFSRFFYHVSDIPGPMDWVRDFIVEILLLAIAALVLLWQYRSRATTFSRIFAILALNLMGALFLFLPFSLPMTIQSWLSAQPELASTVTVKAQYPPLAQPVNVARVVDHIAIPLVLETEGLPNGTDIRSDALAVRFEWPDQTWSQTISVGAERHSHIGNSAVFGAMIQMDPALFREKSEAPFTIRGELYLTLFKQDDARTTSLREGAVNMQSGLRCYLGAGFLQLNSPVCRSAFRWPDRLVFSKATSRADAVEADFHGNNSISYSPLPAEMSIDPFETRSGDSIDTGAVMIITKTPLVHFRRDFEVRNARLSDMDYRKRMAMPHPLMETKH